MYCLGKQESVAAFLDAAPVNLKYFLKQVLQPLKTAGFHSVQISAEFMAELDIVSVFACGKHNDLHFFQGIFPAADFRKAVKSVFDGHIDIQEDHIRQAVCGLLKGIEQFLPVAGSLYGSRQIQILDSIQKQHSVVFIVVSYQYDFMGIMEF